MENARCASWSIYPRVHGDPNDISRPAGLADQNGERIKVEMGHRIQYKSVQNECMELADGAAKLRDLALEAEQRRVSKHNLTKTSWSYGRNGPGAKYAISGRMPRIPPGDHRATSVFDNTVQPRPYLWDYKRRCPRRTTMRDCMDGGISPKGENIGKPAFAVDPRELRARLGTSTHRDGDDRWHGFNKRDTRSHVGAHLAENRASAARRGPVVAAESIEGTIFPSQARSFETSAFATMDPAVYLDRSRARSREAGALPKPTANDGPIALDMPACFEPYRGGRVPVQ